MKIDFSKLETWIHGLIAALLAAVGVTGTEALASCVDGEAINWHHLGSILVVTSLGAAFLYLKQAPFPPLGSLTIQGPGNLSVPEGTTAVVVSNPTSTNADPIKVVDVSKLPPINPTKENP